MWKLVCFVGEHGLILPPCESTVPVPTVPAGATHAAVWVFLCRVFLRPK
jgi:hypothetical protein